MTLKALDYSKRENWARFEDSPSKPVDALWICGTAAQASDLPDGRAELTPQLKKIICFMGGKSSEIFESFTNVYIFYYRQLAMNVMEKINDGKIFLDLLETSGVLNDVFEALDYYFENVNNGRPFIFNGHSQGSAVIQKILEIYMKRHPEYLKKMIAAYAAGFSVTKSWLEENPHIRFAEGETDTGVILSWNTEGPDAAKPSIVLQPESILINPVNWKRDETPADISENMGSRYNNLKELTSAGKPFTFNELRYEIRRPGIADARIDLKRGVLICTTVSDYMEQECFGDKSLHTGDWDLYYENIAENMKKRIRAFLEQANADNRREYLYD